MLANNLLLVFVFAWALVAAVTRFAFLAATLALHGFAFAVIIGAYAHHWSGKH
jgi:hypothetical protein